MSAIADNQYLTFTVENGLYAIPIEQVREVLEPRSITKLPKAPDYLMGVINVRGKSVPIANLRNIFGLQGRDAERDGAVIVLDVGDNDGDGAIGALADAVHEVVELDDADIEPNPSMGLEVRETFIKGLGKKDERFIVILDMNRVLGKESQES